MNKNKTRTINVFFTAILFLLHTDSIQMHLSAAGSWKGYAIYRDGVLANVNDHAGLMKYPTRASMPKPVFHIGGYGCYASVATWSAFLDGHNYLGLYKPKNCEMSDAQKANFAYRASQLNGIPYTVVNQIYFDLTASNTRVSPSIIQNIRCDGIVEYAYEWYGFRVGGSDTYWNITYNTAGALNAHSGIMITPRKQRQNLLTFVSSSLPD